MQLRRFNIKTADLLADPAILRVEVPIDSVVQQKINPTIISRKHLRNAQGEKFRGVAVYKPDNTLLFVWLPDVIEESIWLPAYKLLNTVNGGLDNRPNVIGEGMRQQRIRKSDGELTNFKVVSTAVMKTVKGKAGTLGPYRYGKPRPSGFYCERTAWTIRKPKLWLGVQEFIAKIDEVYRDEPMLAEAYARQKKYIDTVPDDWKIEGTNFTTMYVLKDHATAIHWDNFDEHDTFGVMASLGDPDAPWVGNEIVWPKFRYGCDYRPGDVVLGDVHELHGNQQLLDGSRVSCIFFVRTKMNQCPQ
jgi:hypothetical protein